MKNILIVDDEPGIRRTLSMLLEAEGYSPLEATDVDQAKRTLHRNPVDVVLLDLQLKGSYGMDLLRDMRSNGSDVECIIMTAHGTIENAVESMHLGAYDYLTKPVNPNELILRIARVLEKKSLSDEVIRLREELSTQDHLSDIVAESQAMKQILDVVKRIRAQDIPVLITGETGTGKEVVARAIHATSTRSEQRFLAVNCCTLPEELLDSELFGHVKGAFTSATSNAKGLFLQADGGTLFLDEIGDVSPSLQAKLLRVLQDNIVRPVGSEKQLQVDVRIIAATNHDLEARVAAGKFRKDLFFRLNVLPIKIPTLAERPDDISPLIDLFIKRAREKLDRPDLGVTQAARARLVLHNWPGNARQLENVITRGFALTSGAVLDSHEIVFDYAELDEPGPAGSDSEPLTLDELTNRHVQRVLALHDGNQAAAARTLGISRSTLRRKLGLPH